MGAELLERVRLEAGLSQEVLAARAGTSRSTLSAYEHGRKSPTLSTVDRLFDRAGFDLSAEPRVHFVEHARRRGRPVFVPDRLWRLSLTESFATVVLPRSLNWSRPGAVFVLAEQRARARCYEVVLREGMPDDLRAYVDGALLVDLWSELVLPRELRTLWQPLIDDVVR
ncbi:MAG: helix-turn-helix domain-containing protein [Actinobacteria bacterium]|uniref:Unannotated protein n=1 Tax=freshwater metagenome TaxID=449393 RepID=A0A6J6ZC63_9ZZZZ|nr:helix-turn-helix domain-containing protein [Actinomycetota bacterium]MSX86261.1 helix-turn-helix domain-containing protein [Actinomycetota bacterium]MSY71610.1 helix-turn-helix domain-containing protein [Actinomycetota bacterium]